MATQATFSGIATAAAAGGKPKWTDWSSTGPPTEVDAVVIGGGFSGLTAAYDLQQSGLSTVVLEARDRLGGRSWSYQLESGPGIVELGATWINNSTQPSVFSLAEKFGLTTIEQYIKGDQIIQGPDGEVFRLPSLDQLSVDPSPEPSPELEALQLAGTLMALINEAADKVDIRRPNQFPEEQDVTVAEWVAQQGLWDNLVVQAFTRQLTSTLVGREPHELGVQYFLDYVKSGLGFDSLGSEKADGAQYLMIKEGTSAIATELAKAMTSGSVLTSAPATSIVQTKDHVIVSTKSGQKFKSKKVIMANPTNTYKEIDFAPGLPEEKKIVVSNTMPGIYAKMILTYSSPWWREAGLQGKFTSLVGPACFGWEISVPDLSQYSLAVFVSGDVAREWHQLPADQQKKSIIEHMGQMVGEELAEKAHDVLEVNYVEWTKEEHIWGGPTSSMGPGLLRKHGQALREPFGHVHFAGGETAFEWKGYLEGAVTAGQRAAKEVIESLKGEE
ncbi:hypothetical protein PV10_06051 [Exophiala mesophila]|uniref:Amine oxidase n=1 Tax=Exophiala mesophila TaxID=212818 RepID=A0A0D1ZC93_EXOME|nr:uncharacterized protein PV10_06051 [Exophiala mesophila]KIV91519.1 hypothetical protein PV10_06051 [Exophiala mesophila]